MADKDDKSPAGRADAVRGAAVQAFQATAGQAGVTRERAQELADDLASAAGRVIGALDDLRPATADDIRSLREDIRALDGRVAALEAAAAQPAPKRAAQARKAPKAAKPKPKPKPKPAS
jgi:polyhydroxyalkanoate synthesis regulator phasin